MTRLAVLALALLATGCGSEDGQQPTAEPAELARPICDNESL